MNNNLNILPIFLLLALCLGCQSAADDAENTQDLGWPEVRQTHKPFTRWWWMGNAVDAQNIDTLLETYASAGIGGVEIAPIYGAIGYEDRYLDFLSPAWMDALRFTTAKADSLGMAVDMTLGTGWPYGGPQIKPEQAASKLIVQTYQVSPQGLKEKIVVKDAEQQAFAPELIALTAYNNTGEALNLLDKVTADGHLTWKPEKGQWEVYAAFLGKTGQKVKRAAPGGAGYTMDHLSKDALEVYLHRFDTAFDDNIPKIRAFFNDSYEVYDADFSPALFEAFKQQQGYDLRLHIRELVSEENTEQALRIKADFRETMSQMLLNNFTIPWTQWAHEHHALTRNQAHGSPANLLDLYAAVDIPETETFGSTNFPIKGLKKYTNDQRNVAPDPIMMKFASSGAHITGKPLVSSETFTWLGEHFKVSLAQGKPEVEQLFLAGINHVFFHGTTYSPQDAEWPGWLFYASVNMAPSNSWWPHVKGLNQYITRCQSVLQTGSADNELMIYWPVYDLWQQGGKPDMPLTIHHIEEWLHPTDFYRNVEQLMQTGYAVDFTSDQLLDSTQVAQGMLQVADNSQYKALIIPACDYMPLATLQQLLSLAEAGATMIFEKLPDDVPGWNQLEERREEFQQLKEQWQFEPVADQQGLQAMKKGAGVLLLAENIQQALDYKNIRRESLVDSGLKFIRRDINGNKYYYLVNHTAEDMDEQITLQTEANAVVILNPQDGSQGLAAITPQGDSTQVRVQLASGEALILRTTTSETPDIQAWAYIEQKGEPIQVAGNWQLHFEQGGPVLPKDQPLDKLLSWTALADKDAARFSGTATYTTHFTLPEKSAADYLLKLGDVRESARVWINGEEVGYLWSVPYQARVGQYLKQGDNTLRIEVANLMANRIRDLDQRKVAWRKYHEINFVNLAYEPFDASNWEPQPSGLLGPVEIVPLNEQEGS